MSVQTNGFQASAYASEKTTGISSAEIEIASDPASSGFFASDVKKLEDLKQMLDSNKDQQKLDALKQIIGMVARGRNCSELFPAVVKNVVSKNVEVKKLVYVYLTRYAEEQQDLALLSISTFQRALKDPNQLIRGSALRVLSSIRVPMIVPIMMLSIREAANDMSPYVRKTAAHAIPKLYSLDPEQKDYLIEVIEKLLNDPTTLVAGSVIQAFEEVCPERIDLIHKHYRRLCALLVDVEEWGQVVIINMLTRYVRNEFESINKIENSTFDSGSQNRSKVVANSNTESDTDDNSDILMGKFMKDHKEMDPDHRLILRNCKPLLNSRNSAVVMAVAQLYYHCAPQAESAIVTKSLVRLLRSHSEVQFVVLNNIASMTINHRGLFEPYIKSFFVHSSDSSQVKLLKLEILTNMASEASIGLILKEFQSYVTSSDKEFAAATIQAIGRCASQLPEIMDTCMSGLVHLLSKKDETVVAESVVVIRKLLQMQITLKVGSCHKEIIVNMARLVDSITVPMARASILWLIGEYADRIPKIAPDVLRKCAKTFCDEEEVVKLQVLNLAAKLCIVNGKQTRLLVQYVLNLAKYDQNYDIRDRSRFLRAFLFPGSGAVGNATPQQANGEVATPSTNNSEFFSKHAKKILLAPKPAPVLHSKFKDRPPYQLSTLSHLLNHPVNGYTPLPDWPESVPDHAALRDVPVVTPSYISTTGSGSQMTGGGPDAFPRNNNLFMSTTSTHKPGADVGRLEDFYSDLDGEETDASESNEEEEGSDKKGTSDEDSEETDSEEDEDEDDDETSEDTSSEDEAPKIQAKPAQATTQVKPSPILNNSKKQRPKESSSSSSESEDVTSDDESEEDVKPRGRKTTATPQSNNVTTSSTPKSKNAEMPLLLDLYDDLPVMNSTSEPLRPMPIISSVASTPAKVKPSVSPVNTVYIPANVPTKTVEVISRSSAALSHGLAVRYRFSRSLSVFQPHMVCLELQLTNAFSAESGLVLKDIAVHMERLQSHVLVDPFSSVDVLSPGGTTSVMLSVNFRDSTQTVKIPLMAYKENPHDVRHASDVDTEKEQTAQIRDKQLIDITIQPPVGELLQPTTMTDAEFLKLQNGLKGMTEFVSSLTLVREFVQAQKKNQYRGIVMAVYTTANITTVAVIEATPPTSNNVLLRFAGRTVSEQIPCLIEVSIDSETTDESCSCRIRVNCEKITIGSQLDKELMNSISTLVSSSIRS